MLMLVVLRVVVREMVVRVPCLAVLLLVVALAGGWLGCWVREWWWCWLLAEGAHDDVKTKGRYEHVRLVRQCGECCHDIKYVRQRDGTTESLDAIIHTPMTCCWCFDEMKDTTAIWMAIWRVCFVIKGMHWMRKRRAVWGSVAHGLAATGGAAPPHHHAKH